MAQTQGRWLAFAVHGVILAAFLLVVRDYLAPLAMGCVLTLLLTPLERRLAKRSERLRRMAPLFVTSGAVVLILAPVGLITARLVQALNQALALDWTTLLQPIVDELRARHLRVEPLAPEAIAAGRALAASIATGLARVAASLPTLALDGFVLTLTVFYCLRDRESFLAHAHAMSPFRRHETDALFDAITREVRGAVLGIVVTAIAQGTLASIAFATFRVPGAVLLGVLAGLMSVLPVVGTMGVTLGAALYLFVLGRSGAALGMVAASALIGLVDNIVRPIAQRSGSETHPLLALVGILGGIAVFGLPGLFFGPILAGMARWSFASVGSEEPPAPRQS